MNTNLAAVLRQAEFITPAQEQEISNKVSAEGSNVPSALVALGISTGLALAEQISQIFGDAVERLEAYPWEATSQNLGHKEMVLSHQVIPLAIQDNQLFLGICDPTRLDTQDEFRFATGYQVIPVLLEIGQIEGAIRRLYGKRISGESRSVSVSEDELAMLENLDDSGSGVAELNDDAPVSRYIYQVLIDATRKQASDIHFEPYEHSYRIRFRLDGILQIYSEPPLGVSRRLATRLKILAGLNIAERRLPQDGRMKLDIGAGVSIDMRVSSLPTLWGEKIVLRLLDSGNVKLEISQLGYTKGQECSYLNALNKPQGMILVTGPTGSGKTVSLYSGLSYLNQPEKNISTAEDPVEINLPGINQVNVNREIGLDFAAALRSFLRQDPDVVMVGEIRDLETAEIAIKAAQTGHLVLSTLHTNSAAETIVRLANMGVPGYNLASSLSLIIAQRLTRRLCKHCRQPEDLSGENYLFLSKRFAELTQQTIYRANHNGCDHCNNGYLGRLGIYELMPMTPALSEVILHSANAMELEHQAIKEGMHTLSKSGIRAVCEGITSLEEVQRVIQLR